MENWINWDGVSRRDKSRLFAREVDPEKLSPGVRALFFGSDKYGVEKDEQEPAKAREPEAER